MSPLPMVRLCFVGRGRAGKTTTLRRLKGEETIEGKEVSTYGLQEYVVLKVDGGEEADCKLKALQELSLQIQALCQNIQKLTESERKGPIRCHWSGLKAGKGENRQTLVWRAEEILHGEKAGVPLYQALEQGHGSWTAKIDVFAKVNLFSNAPSHAAHFYEVTNVIRFGYSVGSSNIIQPVTKEKDFLKAVQMNIREYSSEHPKALKYVKRLWERSAFMAQRSFHVDQHFQMLQALKPIFRHWVAELAQIAAHAETLTNMLVAKDKDLQQMQDDALADVDVLCENVGVLQTKCRSTKLLRADEEVRNQEAIIVDRGTLQILDVDRHHPFKPDQGKVVTEVVLQLKNGDRKFRIITTHLPGKLQNVHFIPISYPTNLCQGSLLPKRIDCIASLSSKEQLKAEPMKADEVLPNLTELVELLASRSWDLAEPVLSPLLEEQPLEAAAEVFAGSLNGLWAERCVVFAEPDASAGEVQLEKRLKAKEMEAKDLLGALEQVVERLKSRCKELTPVGYQSDKAVCPSPREQLGGCQRPLEDSASEGNRDLRQVHRMCNKAMRIGNGRLWMTSLRSVERSAALLCS
eukprot:g30907.t1